VTAPRRFKLKLSKLDFVSLVDQPAQETASIRLIKRAVDAREADEIQAQATARVVKIGDGDNPLVHCWAFTCTDETGQPYHDLQGDAIGADFIKAAETFMHSGAAVDEMHDGQQTSRVAFAYPMDSDVARAMFGKAVGDGVKTSGLMVAIRPSPEALGKLRSGAYTGVSIAGLGTREPVDKAMAMPMTKCADCGAMCGADDAYCAACGARQAAKQGAKKALSAAAPVAISTPLVAVPTVKSQEQSMPTEQEIKIAELTKTVARLEQVASLSDAQRAHHATLRGQDAEGFLAKSQLERDAVLKAVGDADAPIYKTASGIEIRRSDGSVALQLAKQSDAAAVVQATQAEALAKSQALAETQAFEKRAATDLSAFAKTMPVHIAIMRALDAIPDETIRKEALEAIKAANVAMVALGKAHGTSNGSPLEADALEEFEKARAAFATIRKIADPIDATGAFLATAEGRALKAAYDATRGYAAGPAS